MATTTNYGWDTPDDTDLVKDGAAAIRTLGSSVDTTTKNLNPETTTGDIAYRSATANTNTRLALGTAGQILTVNSGATAPEWATPAAGGGKTLLSTTSLSGSSTVISGISGDYTDLEMVIYGVSLSTATQIYVKPNGNINTRWVVARAVGSTPTKEVDAVSTSADVITPAGGVNLLASNTNNGFVMKINNYASTAISYKPFSFYGQGQSNNNTSTPIITSGGGAVNEAGAITSITVTPAGGTFTGTFLIYGVK
jgi:hypothetical protein